MAIPISVDLRKRIIAKVEEGRRVEDVAPLFSVALSTIYEWIKLKEKTNSLNPKIGYQKGHSHGIKDYDKFTKFAYQYAATHTAQELADLWHQQTGDSTSRSAVSRVLNRIGYSYKKKLFLTSKQTRKNGKNISMSLLP